MRRGYQVARYNLLLFLGVNPRQLPKGEAIEAVGIKTGG
jgi:hypothetical protein